MKASMFINSTKLQLQQSMELIPLWNLNKQQPWMIYYVMRFMLANEAGISFFFIFLMFWFQGNPLPYHSADHPDGFNFVFAPWSMMCSFWELLHEYEERHM